jgi:hypothetical protein
MHSKSIKIIAIFTFVSLVILLLIFWLIEFAGINLPQIIPSVELNTHGLFILASYIVIFILLQKQLLKVKTDTSAFELTSASTILTAISQLLYFSIREIILGQDFLGEIFTILLVTLLSTVCLSLIAATIAFEIKKVKGIWKYIPTAILFLLLLLTKDYINNFKW